MTYDARDRTVEANEVFALDSAHKALKTLNLPITNYSELTNVIEAESGMTWSSFGLRLTVQVLGLGPKRSQISITASDDQALNWGAGLKLIQQIFELTQSLAESKQRKADRDDLREQEEAKEREAKLRRQLYESPKFVPCIACGADLDPLARRCHVCSKGRVLRCSDLPEA